MAAGVDVGAQVGRRVVAEGGRVEVFGADAGLECLRIAQAGLAAGVHAAFAQLQARLAQLQQVVGQRRLQVQPQSVLAINTDSGDLSWLAKGVHAGDATVGGGAGNPTADGPTPRIVP